MRLRHHGVDLTERVHELNAEFTEPLPASEARAIATSIRKWITTTSPIWADGPAVYEATFTAIRSARSRKSGTTRRGNKLDLVMQTIEESRRA